MLTINESTITQLEALGAKPWTCETKGYKRLYLNNSAKKLLDIEISYYNTGNICGACMLGEGVSNCKMRKILAVIDKCYIDLNTNELHTFTSNHLYSLSEELKNILEKKINALPAVLV